MTFDIDCPRCDKKHFNMTFQKLGKPVVILKEDVVIHTYDVWCQCPVTDEPILGKLLEPKKEGD